MEIVDEIDVNLISAGLYILNLKTQSGVSKSVKVAVE